MRRFAFSLAVLTLVAAGNICAADESKQADEQIAQSIVTQLRNHQEAGRLKDFDIDLNVEEGRVTLTGNVADQKQHQMAIDAARFAPGVKVVVNDLKIDGQTHAHPAQQKQAEASVGTGLQNPMAKPEQQETTNLVSELRTAWSQPQAQPQFAGTQIDEISNPDPLQENQQVEQGYSSFTNQQQATPIATVGEVAGAPQMIQQAQQQPAAEENIVASSQPSQWEPRVAQAAANDVNQQAQLASNQVAAGPQTTQPQVAPQQPQRQYVQLVPVPVPVYQQPAQRGPVAYAASNLPGSQRGHVRMAQALQAQQVAPAPQFIQGTSGGMAPPARYDHPNMPGYAWPSYASHPNYAALQYPKQYSAHAWPYIGPFYPYPQVPLGWRKVTLAWDDGWWRLDFKDRGYGPYVTR